MLQRSYGYEGGSQSLISALVNYGLWEIFELILNFPWNFVKNSPGKLAYKRWGNEVVLMKNNSGRVIGFEKLNFSVSKPEKFQVVFETVAS